MTIRYVPVVDEVSAVTQSSHPEVAGSGFEEPKLVF